MKPVFYLITALVVLAGTVLSDCNQQFSPTEITDERPFGITRVHFQERSIFILGEFENDSNNVELLADSNNVELLARINNKKGSFHKSIKLSEASTTTLRRGTTTIKKLVIIELEVTLEEQNEVMVYGLLLGVSGKNGSIIGLANEENTISVMFNLCSPGGTMQCQGCSDSSDSKTDVCGSDGVIYDRFCILSVKACLEKNSFLRADPMACSSINTSNNNINNGNNNGNDDDVLDSGGNTVNLEKLVKESDTQASIVNMNKSDDDDDDSGAVKINTENENGRGNWNKSYKVLDFDGKVVDFNKLVTDSENEQGRLISNSKNDADGDGSVKVMNSDGVMVDLDSLVVNEDDNGDTQQQQSETIITDSSVVEDVNGTSTNSSSSSSSSSSNVTVELVRVRHENKRALGFFIGIAILCVIVVVVAAGAFYYLYRQRRKVTEKENFEQLRNTLYSDRVGGGSGQPDLFKISRDGIFEPGFSNPGTRKNSTLAFSDFNYDSPRASYLDLLNPESERRGSDATFQAGFV